MTDRDHFAAAALTGLLAVMRDESMAELCESAYDWADAMLCVRGVTEPMPKEKQAEVSGAEPVAWTHVDAAGISRQGTGDTPDSQPTLAQGSVRGEFTDPPSAASAGASYGKDDAKRTIANMSGEWIPVTDRLPPDGVLVLAYRKRCEYGFRRDGQWIDTLYGGVLGNGPTHWMPLPAPPTDAK